MPRRISPYATSDAALLRRCAVAERALGAARKRIAALEAKLGNKADEATIFEADQRGYRRGYAAGLRARSRKGSNDG